MDEIETQVSHSHETYEKGKSISNRIQLLLQYLNTGLLEREDIINKTLLASLAGESIFFYGPPGVAKSLISRRLKYIYSDATSFEYLMNRFSTPDELFGPLSVSKLKSEDKLERNVENYLPSTHIAFLDEIWKASPSIQNTLLTIINEKIYKNGSQTIHVPLITLLAASNELPMKNQGLDALWDRFIMRLKVENVQELSSFYELLQAGKISPINIPSALKISSDEYDHIQDEIDRIKVPDEIVGIIFRLRQLILQYNETLVEHENSIYVSDRRWKKITHVLKTAAYLNGRSEINLIDCFLISDMIWNDTMQISTITELIKQSFTAYFQQIEGIFDEITTAIEQIRLSIERRTRTILVQNSTRFSYFQDEYNIQHIETEFLGNSDKYTELAKSKYIYNWHNRFSTSWIPSDGDIIGLCSSSFNHIDTFKIIKTEEKEDSLLFFINFYEQPFRIALKEQPEPMDEEPLDAISTTITNLQIQIINLENEVGNKTYSLNQTINSHLFIRAENIGFLNKISEEFSTKISQAQLRLEELESTTSGLSNLD